MLYADGEQLAAFKGIFEAIYHIFPCPVCRGHFRSFYYDPTLQRELVNVATKHGAMLFAWKVERVCVCTCVCVGGCFWSALCLGKVKNPLPERKIL